MTPLDAECLLAAISPGRVLFGKPSLHKYQVQDAAKIPTEMRRRLVRFLSTDDMAPAKDYPTYDYDEIKKLVSAGVTAKQHAALQDAVPDPEIAQELGVEAERILTWANGVLPRESRDTIRGPIEETPADATLGDFWRLWQVATDPMTVFDDLAEGILSDDMVAAFATCWPALHAEAMQAVSDAIATMGGRRRTWEPTMAKAAQLGVLKQHDLFDVELAAACQASYSAEPEPQGPGASKATPGGSDDTTELTPGQKSGND